MGKTMPTNAYVPDTPGSFLDLVAVAYGTEQWNDSRSVHPRAMFHPDFAVLFLLKG
jgi:hypothetical protein